MYTNLYELNTGDVCLYSGKSNTKQYNDGELTCSDIACSLSFLLECYATLAHNYCSTHANVCRLHYWNKLISFVKMTISCAFYSGVATGGLGAAPN